MNIMKTRLSSFFLLSAFCLGTVSSDMFGMKRNFNDMSQSEEDKKIKYKKIEEEIKEEIEKEEEIKESSSEVKFNWDMLNKTCEDEEIKTFFKSILKKIICHEKINPRDLSFATEKINKFLTEEYANITCSQALKEVEAEFTFGGFF